MAKTFSPLTRLRPATAWQGHQDTKLKKIKKLSALVS
jgi:hypothetical protein